MMGMAEMRMALDPETGLLSARILPAEGFHGAAQAKALHGTHVAGSLPRRMNNGIGMAGMTNARILPVRRAGKCGGYDSDMIDGMRWAAGLAVPGVPPTLIRRRCLYMSLGKRRGSRLLASLSKYAGTDITKSGKIIVALPVMMVLYTLSHRQIAPSHFVTAHCHDGEMLVCHHRAGTLLVLPRGLRGMNPIASQQITRNIFALEHRSYARPLTVT